jgi:hypothetical protein
MKSGKQRRVEIMARRRERAVAVVGLDPFKRVRRLPVGSVAADSSKLAHNNTYGALPVFYVDRLFSCRDCGIEEVWTAKQQKWWYEDAHGSIYSAAVRCRACRRVEQARVAQARLASAEGLRLKNELKKNIK